MKQSLRVIEKQLKEHDMERKVIDDYNQHMSLKDRAQKYRSHLFDLMQPLSDEVGGTGSCYKYSMILTPRVLYLSHRKSSR